MKFRESETVEFKRSISGLDSSIKTICAFLNNKGGEVYFGIDKSGKVIGQIATDANLKSISHKIRHKINPEIIPGIEELKIDGKTVIKVTVANHDDYLYYCNGVAYTRCGTETVIIPPDDIRRRILSNNSINWEKEICKGAKISDLNNDTINFFKQLARKSNRIKVKNENIKLLLKKLKLIEGNKVTNAAMLVFGKDPYSFFPNITIKCGRFKDEKKKEFINMKDYNGNLFNNLEDCMLFLQNHLRIEAKIKGLLREEKWEIPLDALRESILNAIIHRDYSVKSFVYIKFYDEKIVIANPGRLPEELSIEDLYKEHESRLRNPLIAEVFYMAGFIDAWGRGILDILEMMDKEDLDKPGFEETGDSFRIIFNRPVTPQATPQATPQVLLTDLEERVLDEIKNNSRVSRRLIAENLNIGVDTVKEYINRLKKKGVLKRIGKTNKGYWKIVNYNK
jgi:ATP-dependent DNA helicase RecG